MSPYPPHSGYASKLMRGSTSSQWARRTGSRSAILECPDRLILHQLMDADSVLITTDRPLHNQVVELRLRSFHVGPEHITCRCLPGVHPRPLGRASERPAALKTDYRPALPPLRSVLMPSSATRLKKLNVKRRRIRNYFGGLDQLAQSAISVSYVAQGATALIGVRLRISSHSEVKALDASESYIAESVESELHDQVAFCHALVVPVQLLLHQISTVVYYDATRMRGPNDQPDGLLAEFFGKVAACFPQLAFTPVSKGRHLERMHHKLNDLRTAPMNNEIRPGTLHELLHQQSWWKKSAALLHVP